MAGKLIECVPNFSEGRRQDVIESIVDNFRGVKGCSLLYYFSFVFHNRLVVSLAWDPSPLSDALV